MLNDTNAKAAFVCEIECGVLRTLLMGPSTNRELADETLHVLPEKGAVYLDSTWVYDESRKGSAKAPWNLWQQNSQMMVAKHSNQVPCSVSNIFGI